MLELSILHKCAITVDVGSVLLVVIVVVTFVARHFVAINNNIHDMRSCSFAAWPGSDFLNPRKSRNVPGIRSRTNSSSRTQQGYELVLPHYCASLHVGDDLKYLS